MAWNDTDLQFRIHEAATGTLSDITSADLGTLIIEDSGSVAYFNSLGEKIIIGGNVEQAINNLVTNLAGQVLVTNITSATRTSGNTYTFAVNTVDPNTGAKANTSFTIEIVTGAMTDTEILPVAGKDAKKYVDDEIASAVEAINGQLALKLVGVTAGDGIEIDATTNATNPTIAVKLADDENVLKIDENGNLTAVLPTETDYTVSMSANDGVYTFSQLGKEIGTVNVPKDMVVTSGVLERNPAGQPEGTYLVLTIANKDEDKVYINLSELIDIDDFLITGTDTATIDITVIASDIPGAYEIKAEIKDGSISKTKLDTSVQTSLDKADSAIQQNDLDSAISTFETSIKQYIDTADGTTLESAKSDATTKANTAESNAKAYTDAALTIKRYTAE